MCVCIYTTRRKPAQMRRLCAPPAVLYLFPSPLPSSAPLVPAVFFVFPPIPSSQNTHFTIYIYIHSMAPHPSRPLSLSLLVLSPRRLCVAGPHHRHRHHPHSRHAQQISKGARAGDGCPSQGTYLSASSPSSSSFSSLPFCLFVCCLACVFSLSL